MKRKIPVLLFLSIFPLTFLKAETNDTTVNFNMTGYAAIGDSTQGAPEAR
jgi:hypothetical protein